MHGAGSPAADGELTRLDRAQSLRLLTRVPVGRLIFTVNALPTVRPMNFAWPALIVLRTAADTTVARRVDGEIVAFQADDLDVATSSGWSVTVAGRGNLRPGQASKPPRCLRRPGAAGSAGHHRTHRSASASSS